MNVPVDELRGRLDELREERWIVNCQVGKRAHVAAQLLAAHGIEARNLDGGWLTWRNSPAASSERGQAAAVAPAPGHRRSSSDLAVKAS